MKLHNKLKFVYLLLVIALFFGCGSGETAKDPGGTLTIHSPSFPEIQGMVSKVAAYLQEDVAGFNCPLTVDSDTTLSGQCSDIPNGTHTYTIKYVHTDTGVILATTVSAATMEQGQNHDITFPTLSKNYDDDGDGYANVVEIGNGSNPKDPNSYPYNPSDTTSPVTPELSSPTDGSSTSGNTPAFDWTDVTDTSGVTYEIQVDNDSSFSSLAINQVGLTASNYTLTDSLPDGTYYWRVRARDGSGNIASDGYPGNPADWSGSWSITVSKTYDTSGLVAYYPFNGNANDESGYGYNGTVNGATLTTDRFGNASSAYSFDGINDYIGLANTGALKFTSGGFTLAAWVNFNNTNTDTMIIGKHSCGYSNGYFLGIGGANNTASNRLNLFVNSDPRLLTSETYNDGNWHLVAGVYDGTNQYLYVDGVLKSSQPKTYSSTSDMDISIGRASGNCGFFNGLIDNVRIYSRTLSVSEIQTIFNSETASPSGPADVTATAGDGQATISWNTVSGAISYNIYWSTTSGVTKTSYTGKIPSNTNSYTHTGLTNGTTYYYVVTAVNSYVESGGSSPPVSATPTSGVISDTTAPSNTTGTNFINSGATATNSTSVTLSVSATDNVGVTGYYASENSSRPSASASGWTSIAPTTPYSASVPFTLSTGDGAKTVYVWFQDASGNVSSSKSDTIILDTMTTDTILSSQPPGSTNSTSPSFSFTSTEVGSTFQCQIDTNGYIPCTSPQTYTTLTEGRYTFCVAATDPAGNMDQSPTCYTWIIDTTPPTIPTGLTAIPISESQIDLTWTSSTGSDEIIGYNVYRDDTLIVFITAPPYSNTGLVLGTTYSYTVSSIDSAGNESGQTVPYIVTTKGTTLSGGNISADTTWTLSGSPYIIANNIWVNGGVTLTIESGVTVRLSSGLFLQIDGALIARGTNTEKVTFTSNKSIPAPGDWGYIFFSDSSTDATYDVNGNYTSGSILEHAIVEYAGSNWTSNNGAVRMDNAHPFVNYATVRNNAASGIYAWNLSGNLNIYNSILTNNTSHNGINNTSHAEGGGIFISYGTASGSATISNNMINNNTSKNDASSGYASSYGGGIYISGTATISNNYIGNNSSSAAIGYSYGGGIYVAGNATLTNNVITNNIVSVSAGSSSFGTGIYVAGSTTISNNVISGNAVYYTYMNSYGGGIYVSGSVSEIYSNAIMRNSATDGSAVICACATYNFQSNLITENEATNTNPYNKHTLTLSSHPIFNYNNIFNNVSTYEMPNTNAQSSADVNAENNWWGTAVESEIQAKIYDWFDNPAKGIVDYTPWDTAIRTDAPISPPTGLTAIAGTGQISLTWTDNPEADRAGYKVYWSTTSGFPHANSVDVGTVTSYTIPGLPAGTYYVTVTVYDTTYNPANDALDTIINDNQTNGNESWFTVEQVVDVP